ncbi:TMV resistance protein N-like [Eucalyptus grandis]|uniref:TMV resistance protein N-like n=1 Tax=Eucalyptus grandis TaxID=71139 RepID=UPI00192F02B8|nr:TMV resistance protein N-like [Eucalyptus grandis]
MVVPAVTAMEAVTAAPASSSHDGGSERGLMAVTALANSSHDGELGGYEVFLSFRGPDTRLTIADSLYEAIKDVGIRVFKDDKELRVGKEIGGSLLQAIDESRIYIPIFSKNYASSKWCLRELTYIVKSSRDDAEKVILPIFYYVDADDVKLKTELYRQALQKHENDSGKDTAKQWEEALKEVVRIKGWNLKDYRYR